MGIKSIVVSIGIIVLGVNSLLADEFPVTVEHKYGSTTIVSEPSRVISLSYQNHDNLLALGVQPIAIRYWYGDFEFGVWPWAEELLGSEKPVILKGDINIEQIAELKPDLIEAMWSGITQDQYDLLSKIAPVVPPLKGYEDYGMPWEKIAAETGVIVGKSEEADAKVEEIESRMAAIRKNHPSWEGKSAAVAYYWSDAPGAYTSSDIRPQFLANLGLITPKKIDDVSGPNAFAIKLSPEDLSPIDTDIVIWFIEERNVETVKNLALRPTLNAYKEGREIYADPTLASAFSHGSLLSLPYVLDQMVPLIESAIDGDPLTLVSSTEEIGLLAE